MTLTLVPLEAQSASRPALAPAAPWLDAWWSSAALGWEAIEKLRSSWLAELRQLSSDTLRSPAFLALMKLNLTLMTLPRGDLR
jgi:hypothetical protein